MDATSVQSNKLLAGLKSLASPTRHPDLECDSLSVRNYDSNTGKETLAGYRAQNTVQVTLKDARQLRKCWPPEWITERPWCRTGLEAAGRRSSVNDALKQAVAHARAKPIRWPPPVEYR